MGKGIGDKMMLPKNNLLDQNGEHNFLFLASVIASLCEKGHLTVNLSDIERFWGGDIIRLQYNIVCDIEKKAGHIVFSLKEKE